MSVFSCGSVHCLNSTLDFGGGNFARQANGLIAGKSTC